MKAAALFVSLAFFPQGSAPASRPESRPESRPSIEEMLSVAVDQLLECEEKGSWPYEGVYRERTEIPLGYRVGGTSLAGTTLLFATKEGDARAAGAIERARDFVLQQIDDPKLAPSTSDVYDVRIWGQACALEFFCYLKAKKRAASKGK